MTTKMASVHQKSQSILLANGVKSRYKEVKPDATGTSSYHFDNLDVVDDAGNVIAYTVSRRTC